ncbi:hypothetical protein [Thermococcus paralvinellae]|uniref:Restriction endonuclease type IV Mrr domain-containing protein n=1 Tax=Thermococcus paralvinellae TaxID=582419 RepID=W0I4R0_9EURY|nr:hypothetical protein [Thermococcus paralvinellae]AHF81091.1 Hypothetical protein TES1_1716 [Thermococcus paralvinellae]
MEVLEIKVKSLLKEAEELCALHGFRAVREFRSKDGSRIDLVILKEDGKVLAVEFENSYKWIKQRILYNAVKAKRAGFNRLVIVYPFNNDPLSRSWVEEYVKDELGVELILVKPDGFLSTLKESLKVKDQ